MQHKYCWKLVVKCVKAVDTPSSSFSYLLFYIFHIFHIMIYLKSCFQHDFLSLKKWAYDQGDMVEGLQIPATDALMHPKHLYAIVNMI
jgi:hypothetical protein